MMKKNIGVWLLLLAILGWFAVLRPQIKSFSVNALAVKVKNEEVKSYDQRLTDLKDIKAKGEAVQSTLRSLFLAMPKSSQVPEALVMVENLGNESGVTFTTVNVGVADGSVVPATITFSGNQSAVNSFMDSVYKNVRTATVKSQTVTADASGSLTVGLELGFIYQGGSNAVQ